MSLVSVVELILPEPLSVDEQALSFDCSCRGSEIFVTRVVELVALVGALLLLTLLLLLLLLLLLMVERLNKRLILERNESCMPSARRTVLMAFFNT